MLKKLVFSVLGCTLLSVSAFNAVYASDSESSDSVLNDSMPNNPGDSDQDSMFKPDVDNDSDDAPTKMKKQEDTPSSEDFAPAPAADDFAPAPSEEN